MVSRAWTQATSRAFRAKRRDRAAQLVGLRPVLGVVDRGVGAGRKGERGVERFRFGPRSACGCELELEVRGQLEAVERCQGLAIVGLERKNDLQFLARIIQRIERGDQLLDRSGLAVECDNNRVARQVAIGDRRRRGYRRRAGADQKPEQEPDQEESGQHRRDQDERWFGNDQRCGHQQGCDRDKPVQDFGIAGCGRKLRRAKEQIVGGLCGQRLGRAAADEGV